MADIPSSEIAEAQVLNPNNELFKLTEQEKEELKQRIQKWDGTVRLFVHPSFYSDNHHPKALENMPGHEETQKLVKRILALDEEKTPPIIIMAEHQHLEKSFQLFESESKQRSFFISTESSDSAIYHQPDGYAKLADFFAELGVKRILIGGQVLWIDTNELQDTGNIHIPKSYEYEDQRPELSGCTGEVIKRLNDERLKLRSQTYLILINPQK